MKSILEFLLYFILPAHHMRRNHEFSQRNVRRIFERVYQRVLRRVITRALIDARRREGNLRRLRVEEKRKRLKVGKLYKKASLEKEVTG